jgi:hypothetical protein
MVEVDIIMLLSTTGKAIWPSILFKEKDLVFIGYRCRCWVYFVKETTFGVQLGGR